MIGLERFVRVPTVILEALVRERFSGGQYRVIFWVIRNTYGWNRSYAPFTWYRISREIRMSRPAVYRAGRWLLGAGILVVHEGQLSIKVTEHPHGPSLKPNASKQPCSLPGGNTTVAGRQPERCLGATNLPPAKDIQKDISKINKDKQNDARKRATGETQKEHLAGAAQPIAGKYDGISEN